MQFTMCTYFKCRHLLLMSRAPKSQSLKSTGCLGLRGISSSGWRTWCLQYLGWDIFAWAEAFGILDDISVNFITKAWVFAFIEQNLSLTRSLRKKYSGLYKGLEALSQQVLGTNSEHIPSNLPFRCFDWQALHTGEKCMCRGWSLIRSWFITVYKCTIQCVV